MLLAQLSEAAGVSGQETEIRELIKSLARERGSEVQTDALGNVIARKPGRRGKPVVMLAAHMDEVGLMVTGIEKEGFLRFRPVGAVDERVLVAKHVRVGRDKVPGVIGCKPVHLQEPDERKEPIKLKDLYIDIGAKNRKEAEKLVHLGDGVVFATRFERLEGSLVKGKAFDDRVGCTVLLDLLQEQYDFDLVCAFTVQEEVGLRGAGVAAFTVSPDIALVIEGTTAGDVPDIPGHKQSTIVGKGPALTLMDKSVIPSKPLLERLLEVAKLRDIETQFRRTTTGGTDAGKIRLTKGGIPVAGVSLPCRYIHSPVSIMSLADLEKATRLVKGFLQSIDEQGLPEGT